MRAPTGRAVRSVSQKPQVDTEAFVTAVIRTHESLVRSLRRLAAGVAWPVDGDAMADRRIMESYCDVPSRDDAGADGFRPAFEVVRW